MFIFSKSEVLKRLIFSGIFLLSINACIGQLQPVANADAIIRCLNVYNNELFIGGSFNTIGGISANKISKYNGSNFVQVASGAGGNYVEYLQQYNTSLLIGGNFPAAGSIYTSNGANLTSMPGLSGSTVPGGAVVTCSAVFNGELWVGGDFTSPSKGLAKWNGSSWIGIGNGIDFTPGGGHYVNDMIVYNNELYIGGIFTSINGVQANYIAKFNGTTWTPVGTGMNQWIGKFLVVNGSLYVGGIFTNAGGVSANKLAVWNGSTWSTIGNDFGTGFIVDLCYYNNELYAAGDFSTAGGATVNYIAKWNGVNWITVGGGTNGYVSSIAEFGGNLYIGGSFTAANNAVCRLAMLIPPNQGTVSALNCNTFTQSGNLFSGQVAANVSVTAPYTGGNAGYYAGQNVSSTGVTGLTATLTSGTLANGNGTVSYTITGTPSAVGNATFAISLGGQSCNLVLPVTTLSSQYPAGSVFCANGPTAIVDVTNPTTGKTWMDRNLGASQVATSSTDAASYGDLYQWGRRADGHQCRTSPTTATLSSVDQPAHGNFILAPNAPFDWRSPQNVNLWQGVTGVNNPCPSGYKVPTETEVNNDRLSWSQNNSVGAFASPLKYPMAGSRFYDNGTLNNVGLGGSYWSSEVSGTYSRYLGFLNISNAFMSDSYRANGCALRCIKETVGTIDAINCNGTTQSGTLYNNQPVSSVTASVPYTGGNGGYYPTQSIASTGVTGLTASLTNGLFANGAGTLSFTISGTPSAVGTATFALNIGGQACSFILNVQSFATLSINTNDTICNGISTTLTASVANAGTSCAAPGLSGTLTSGLVGYWPFCGNANDLSGNANNGTVNGATLTTDRFGAANQAYLFNGVNNYIEVIHNATFDLESNNSITISTWFLTSSTNGSVFVQKQSGVGATQNGFNCGLLNVSGALCGVSKKTSGNQSLIAFGPNGYNNSTWHNFVYSFTNGNAKLYYDGQLINAQTDIGSIVANSITNLFFGVGLPQNTAYFNGKLDDIGLWNRALTQQEITQLYNSGQATYSWSPGGAATPSITVSPAQTTTYTCTITMNGVSTTQTQTITVNALPTVSAGANQTVCAGTAVTLNGSGATSYTWNNNVQNGVAFTPNTTQTYTLTGTNANGCNNTAQTAVTVNPLPTATITAQGATTFCQNNSLTLNANAGAGLSYQWYNNGTAINAANSATLPVNTSGSYTVQVTNANNCSAMAAATAVTVNALPAATITPASATTFCQGGSVVLNANVGQGLYYQWNLNGSPINGANTATYTASATGNYSLDVLNSDGCSATSSVVSVIVNALPNVSAGANQSLCAGTVLTLSGTGASTYSWNNNVQNGVAFTPNSTQTYTVTGTNANGCSNTAQVTITVNALPTPTISYVGSPILCQGSVLALNSSAGSSYLWSNGQTTQTIQANQGGAYTVQVSNASGCVGTSNAISITVNPLPAPSITAQGPTTFCQGGSVVLTSTGATSYSWSTNATTQSITVTTSGQYQITVVDNKGCSGSSAAIQVTVLSPPSAVVSTIGANALCAGQSTTLSAPAGNTYLWSNGSTTQNITVNSAGTYSVQVTNGAGCSATSTPINISVNPVPAATITTNGVSSFCNGGSVVLTASAGNSYLWNTGATTQSITVNASGSFTATVTGVGGCNATSAATTITVNALPAATITPNGPTTFCAGGTLLLSASAGSSYLWSNGVNTPSLSVNSSGSYTVTVTNGAGCSVTTSPVNVTVNALPTVSAGANQTLCAGTALSLNGTGATTYSWNNGVTNGVTFTPANTQTYTVTGTNANGCVNTAQVTVTVNALPTVSAGASQIVCSGTSVTLSGTGATSYVWNNGVTNGLNFTPANTQTYTVTGTNANGCANTAQVTVTVNALPTVSAGANQTVCSGTPVSLNGTGATTYSWNNGVTNGVNFTPANTQTYTVTGTNANGCANTAQVTVTVNALPTVSAGANQTVCSGTPVSLNGTGATTYAWNNGVTNGVTFTPANTQTYTVTGTNANGCVNTAQVTVTVNALPTVSAGANQTVCSGTSVTLSGTGATSYVWNNGVTNGVNFTPANTQTYTVTGTNANGCANTAQVTVTVNALPTVSAGANQIVCSGTPVSLNGTGATTYSWNNGVTNGVNFTPANTQTYIVTGTNANGCANTAQVTVTVNALPTVSAGTNQTVCSGTSVTLSGSGATSYVWNNGVTNATAFIPANTQTYTVTGTNANGCANTAQVTVTVNALPTVSAGANQTVCAGTSVTLSGSGATSYAWNNGVTNATVFTPANTQTYTVTGTNANGCANTAQVTVTVNALPTVSAGANQTVCSGTPVSLNGTGATTYSWNNGVTNGVPFTPVNTQTYTVTGTNANGCANTAQVTVTVNALPTVSAGANQTVCSGTSVTLSGTGATSYVWNNGVTNATAFTPANTQTYTVTGTNANGCANTAQVTVTVNALPTVSAGANQIVCSGTSVTLSGSGATSYVWNNGVTNATAFTPANTQTYTVTGTNANGCANTAQVTVTVNALPTVSAGANQIVCAGSSVTLSGTGATSYVWNNGVTNATAFTPANTQTYTVTGTNANGCTNTAQVTVTVNALPTVSAGANQTVCAGTSVILSGSGATTYSWNNGVTNGVAFTPANTQTYTVTGTNANGCANTAQVTVTVNALPTVSAGANQIVCSGTSVTLSGSGATSYVWNNGVTNGVTFTPANTQTYIVTGTNANGCTNTAQVTVTVNPLPSPTLLAIGTSPYCPGTSVILSTTSMAGYTYQWYIGQNSINGAISANYSATVAGLYSVLVTAPGGCFATSNSIGVSYLNPTIIALGPTSICQGGNVVLQTVAGVGFQYTWMKNGMYMMNPSNFATYTVTSPGIYKVKIVTPSGCVMYSNSITISFLSNPTASISGSGSLNICAGNSITLSAANNTNTVTYQWRKNGINISGATSQTYVATQSGTYTVVIANQACPATSAVVSNTLTVQVFPTPNPLISTTGTFVTPGVSVTLSTANVAGNTYQWQKLIGTTFLAIQGATQSTYTTSLSGTYRVKVTNIYGCWKNSNSITIASSQMPEQGVSCLSDGIHVKNAADVPVDGIWYEESEQARTRIETRWMEDSREWILTEMGTGNYVYITIDEEMEQQWIRLVDVCDVRGIVAYPNPTWNVFYLKGLDLEDKHYELYDLMGRVVAVGNISSASNAVDISSLEPGAYRLVLQGYGVISIVKE